LCAQTAVPTTYSVVEINSMLGMPVTQHIYRDGSHAVIENQSGDTLVRAIYDLDAHKNVSWDLRKPQAGCGTTNFSGDWGDPFSGDDLMGELKKEHIKQTGTETVNGFATNVLETDGTGPSKLKAKAWIDQKYGFFVKVAVEQNGQMTTMLELKSATFAPPPSGMFKIPAFCNAAVKAAAAPAGTATAPTTDPAVAKRYAAEIGGKPEDFVAAAQGPGSKESCSVAFRVVQAGTMTPITSNLEIVVDRKPDFEHPSPCKDAMTASNYHTYTGAGCTLQDVTPQYKNGVAKLDAVPESFNLSVIFQPDGAQSGALIHRQCAGPVTTLFLVMKDPKNVSAGTDWVFVKSGKYAATK
jgi:hypothetical protein